jgi:predicted ArsR family transcriptional regulator
MVMNGSHKIDARIIQVLHDLGKASLGEIAQRLQVNKSYVRQRLQVLEEEGLVERPFRGIYQLKKSRAQAS